MKPLIIYHGNCADGFTAAWVARRYFGVDGAEYFAATHGEEPPLDQAHGRLVRAHGRHVYLLDFCYKGETMEKLLRAAEKLTILDHHKTAVDEWGFLLEEGLAYGVFDMHRSGARLAWDWFFPGEAPPQALSVVEDRDLWRFRFTQTRAVMAAIFSYPYEFEVWDWLMQVDLDGLQQAGEGILRKQAKDIEEFLGENQYRLRIGGHVVPVANLPYFYASEAGHVLAEQAPFAAVYWDTPTGRVFSLRSVEDGVDVSEVAKTYGGGGHVHAAGFQVSADHPLAKGEEE